MDPKKFRLTPKYRWFYGLFGMLILFPLALAILCVAGFWITLFIFSEIGLAEGAFFVMAPLLLIAFFGTPVLFYLHIKKSHFTVTPAGIDYSFWPSVSLQANWDQVSAISRNRYLFLLNLDVIKLKAFTKTGLNWLPFGMVHLSYFEGWPEGELADEIEKYVPQFFE